MPIRIGLTHHTEYCYDRPVQLNPHIIRLRPAPHCRTPIEAYSLNIEPASHFINWQQDPFGNFLARIVFPEPTRKFSITVDLIAEMSAINPFDFFIEDSAIEYPFAYTPELARDLAPYLEITEEGPLLQGWLSKCSYSNKNTIDFLVALNQELSNDIQYSIRMEPGVQTCEETLGRATGSCRDSAWLMVQILRHLGIAARFASGYLAQLKPDQTSLDGPSGASEDFTDLHAWAEAYIPGAGWIGMDPTSGLLTGEGHIPLACTPEPLTAAAISGSFAGEAKTEFKFHNEVTRITETRRVTKPYADAEWTAINQLGLEVDDHLIANDVRLTQGGEPTFVSVDDMESPEWNTAADGPHKRGRAHELLKRLRDQFAPQGLLLYGQGKWYPGEQLPRWMLGCYWRRDGKAIWNNPELLADTSRHYGLNASHAEQFLHQLSQRLGLHPDFCQPAYEDTAYYLWRESRVPANINPRTAGLEDDIERQRLAKLLDRGLSVPTGYALPLRWDYSIQGWASSHWRFRRDDMYLIPGDSPMGYRLPLDALDWSDPSTREQPQPRSLFEHLPPLQDHYGEITRRYSQFAGVKLPVDRLSQWPCDDERNPVALTHTALCAEPRDGRLYIFMPPLTHLEHYLQLIAAIEATAETLGIPLVIEGYEPPRDPRLVKLMVTPDPGVIEVNIHPASNWTNLCEQTHILYNQARLSRLGTEKFMLDGRHTGTGGGNHITLGGATPADSPMLRRPDLLRSLLTYWQHHPSLSYLFSGLFVGPTSQAPRIDEARHDQLYELEIAFQQMPEGRSPAPWLIDRLLRNLLVDITGNTHRAEFCIDKLYSPDSAQGRLGLVEFRAFEMPPHAEMSLVQMLLLRTLVAHFWKQPYAHPLVRWGTGLHDRYLLPHYVEKDMCEIVADLQEAGFSFQNSWLEPFLGFRFPIYGEVIYEAIHLELRAAIEPWNVLGEEATTGGTARFVDSSVERLQIKLQGLTPSRYMVSCNGRRLPLQATGRQGEYIAGLRYRAWQPPTALHPTIGVHGPLTFDIIDLWHERSIGGCTYHITHPGGRSYDTFPINALEAEGRRRARFWPFGHSPGTPKAVLLSEDAASGPDEFPCTLDLRIRP